MAKYPLNSGPGINFNPNTYDDTNNLLTNPILRNGFRGGYDPNNPQDPANLFMNPLGRTHFMNRYPTQNSQQRQILNTIPLDSLRDPAGLDPGMGGAQGLMPPNPVYYGSRVRVAPDISEDLAYQQMPPLYAPSMNHRHPVADMGYYAPQGIIC